MLIPPTRKLLQVENQLPNNIKSLTVVVIEDEEIRCTGFLYRSNAFITMWSCVETKLRKTMRLIEPPVSDLDRDYTILKPPTKFPKSNLFTTKVLVSSSTEKCCYP